ncbi:MAG: sensor domain-containing diguanylate cyclase [Smithella sp.]|nr:sensor domain-containing diguanylate cyclase [Syntrophaceae bacterium]NTW76679.1 sensor domain-containing diguanylate cyclase [Syntrophaceae bacterium]
MKNSPQSILEDRIKKYESFIHNSRDAILFIRYRDGKILEANAAAVNTYQYSHEELLAKTIFDLRAPEMRDQDMPSMDDTAASHLVTETVHMKKSGERFPVEVNSQGAIIGDEPVLFSIIRDISKRIIAEQLLQESENNLRALLNAVTESFFLMNKDGVILAANETMARRFGIDLDMLAGSCIYDLIEPDIAQLRRDQANLVINTGRPVRFEDIRFNRNIDQVYYPVFDGNGQVVRIAVFGIDITEHRKMEHHLETMALTDQLTGLYNRRGFINLAERQLKFSKRSKQKMLLFFADVDGMKWINDNLGHEDGDKALIDTAKILVKTFRRSDIVSRIGGDEFAILAPEADEKTAEGLLKRLHKLINKNNARKGRKFDISISIGCAVFDPHHHDSLNELMSRADMQMYQDKKSREIGRN